MLLSTLIIRDVAHVLEDMLRVYKSRAVTPDKKALSNWWQEIDGWRDRNCLAHRKDDKAIGLQYAVERLYELTKGPDTFITTEVGHTKWAAQYYRFEDPNRWMTSGGLGTMGYGIPAAAAWQVANPKGFGWIDIKRASRP